MRPRVFPAEDLRVTLTTRPPSQCFNEAAGIPRGRPALLARRPLAARCFDEAAGIPRGRQLRAKGGVSVQEALQMRPRVFPAEDASVALVVVDPDALQ